MVFSGGVSVECIDLDVVAIPTATFQACDGGSIQMEGVIPVPPYCTSALPPPLKLSSPSSPMKASAANVPVKVSSAVVPT